MGGDEFVIIGQDFTGGLVNYNDSTNVLDGDQGERLHRVHDGQHISAIGRDGGGSVRPAT